MNFEDENLYIDSDSLEGWVMDKVDGWRDHYQSNYQEKFDEYYRLWRGVWDGSDSMRASERSKIISPALQQAVESAVAEVEEATFGRGKWFDIQRRHDKTKSVLIFNTYVMQLTEDLEYCKGS